MACYGSQLLAPAEKYNIIIINIFLIKKKCIKCYNKSSIQETLTLSACADNSTNTRKHTKLTDNTGRTGKTGKTGKACNTG